MANTYSNIFIHVVFAVKHRNALILDSYSGELYSYIGGIIKSKGQIPFRINGMPDHVHLAMAIKPSITISDLMRAVKSSSSKWINERGFLPQRFQWQKGFGVFTFGVSQKVLVERYISNQQKYHENQGFREEYIGMLESNSVKYDEEYLFDWILDEE